MKALYKIGIRQRSTLLLRIKQQQSAPIQLEIKTPHPMSIIKHALTLFHEILCLFKEKEEARSENFNKTVGQKSRYIFSER